MRVPYGKAGGMNAGRVFGKMGLFAATEERYVKRNSY